MVKHWLCTDVTVLCIRRHPRRLGRSNGLPLHISYRVHVSLSVWVDGRACSRVRFHVRASVWVTFIFLCFIYVRFPRRFPCSHICKGKKKKLQGRIHLPEASEGVQAVHKTFICKKKIKIIVNAFLCSLFWVINTQAPFCLMTG